MIETDGDQDCGGIHFDEIIKKLFMEKLDDIASEYGLELENFITVFDEGKEAELDD